MKNIRVIVLWALYYAAGGLQTPAVLLSAENPALDAGFRERYAFDQKSSKP